MSFSRTEIHKFNALAAQVPKLLPRKKLAVETAARVMLSLVDPSNLGDPMDRLQKYFTSIKKDGILQIAAADLNEGQIIEYFALKTRPKMQWTVPKECILVPPKRLGNNLVDLSNAFYHEDCEALCRISIDFFLIQCRIELTKKADFAMSNTDPSTTPSATYTPTKPMQIYPESSISAEIENPSDPEKRIRINGRAGWAIGHGERGEDGTLLIAMEAKKRSEFSAGEVQLIAYLAILRHNRRKSGKTNCQTQGFYSDGQRFQFVCIRNDGTIMRSLTYDIGLGHDTIRAPNVSLVFSSIVNLIETAMKSSPTVTPTKPGPQREEEIEQFDSVTMKNMWDLGQQSLLSMTEGDTDDEMDVTRQWSDLVPDKYF